CYDDPELGFDLVNAAERLDVTPSELVRLHTAFEYLVYFVGFAPGLPYMDLPERLTIKRLDTPRTKTPPGSVSIGGAQCCIYPLDTPGGFWVLGRTPLRLYDPGASEPVLLRSGDRVRFRAIDRGARVHGDGAALRNTGGVRGRRDRRRHADHGERRRGASVDDH